MKHKTGRWDGKIDFEDFVTGTLWEIYEESVETNRLLRKIAGEQEPSLNDEDKGILEKAKGIVDDFTQYHRTY